MSGFSDGANKVFTLQHRRGAMQIDGFRDERDMVETVMAYTSAEHTPEDCVAWLQSLRIRITTTIARIKRDWEIHVDDIVPSYQSRVAAFMRECFGPAEAVHQTQRNHRFLEEALELVQSLGCTTAEAHQLVDYVYGRPTGEPHQECGGVMVTLAALCEAAKLDMALAGEDELASVLTRMDRIREKHASKPRFSPLPGSAS